MKWVSDKEHTDRERVAPLAGAWIEISVQTRKKSSVGVAPLAGAWIEMVRRSRSYGVI